MFAQTGPCWELEEKEYSSFWLFFERLSSFNVDGVRVTKKRLIWSFTFCLRAARCQHLDSSVAPWCQFFTMDVLFAAKQKNYYLHQQRIIVCSSLSSQAGWGFIEFLVILTFWRNPDNRSGQAEYTLTLGFCSLLKHLWKKPLNIFFETYWPGDPIKFVCLSCLDHRCQDWLLGLARCQVSVSQPFISQCTMGK